jgi:6-phosphogluconolactonase
LGNSSAKPKKEIAMLQIFETPGEVLAAMAEYFVKTAREAIEKNGRFTVALSGGSSPKGLFELLVSGYRDKIEWAKTYFFFGDERYVPAYHPDSNSLMATKALFEPLNIAPHQIFSIDTSLPPQESARAYQKAIGQHFAPGLPVFDLILLGLGEDAHTASLFPHTSVLNAKEPGVKEIFVADKQVYRITFTAPLINLAKHIAFLVFGESKAEAALQVLTGNTNYHQYPAGLIQPSAGDVAWFMDRAAAALLKR